jgi:hypothetical protein
MAPTEDEMKAAFEAKAALLKSMADNPLTARALAKAILAV